MGGMTVVAIVAGNTAIVKPSSDSPTVAALFIDILFEAGVPARSGQLLHRARAERREKRW